MSIMFYKTDMVEITIGDRVVLDATFAMVKEQDRQWFAERLEERFKQEINRAFNAGRKNAQMQMRQSLGLE